LVVAHRSDSYRKLGRAISDHRCRQGLSHAELAARSGLDRAYFGSIERGERRPSYGRVLDIAKGLGLTGAELVGHAERGSRVDRLESNARRLFR
jgi:transcriptional regulator with XRE-family HTH domain